MIEAIIIGVVILVVVVVAFNPFSSYFRQEGATDRTRSRQKGRTDRTRARQGGRTDRTDSRQEGRNERTDRRRDSKDYRRCTKAARKASGCTAVGVITFQCDRKKYTRLVNKCNSIVKD